MEMNGRAVLVTGGGTGMGRAMAEAFGRAGAKVAVNYRESAAAAEEVAETIRRGGGTALAMQADVACEDAVREMVERVAREFGGLHTLVNNAGWSTRIPHSQMDALTDEIWDRTLNTNLRGAFYCVRASLPHLRRAEGASVVNIASVAGITGMGSSMIYAASKAAMLTMTKSLARALAPAIRVNAIAPGFVRTRFANWPPEAFEAGEALTPLGRLATVEDIASAALYLASEACSTTGATLVIDGGTTELGPRLPS